jgi:hypothetical protein
VSKLGRNVRSGAMVSIVSVSLRVQSTELLSGCHHVGDPFWDGDLTLWGLQVLDGNESAEQLVVVPRGNAFIPAKKVAVYVETRFSSLSDLQGRARSAGPGRRPTVTLPIEPGSV